MVSKQPEESLVYEDFLSWPLTTLKDFLGIRGLRQTGTKAELLARAFGAYELNVPKKFTQQQITQSIITEYKNRLALHKITTDPNSLPEDAWKGSVADWP